MSNQKEIDKYLEEMKMNAGRSGTQSYIETNAGVFHMGDIFEAETNKGHKNYIIFFFVKGEWAYYCHGDRAKKVTVNKFLQLIDYGDLIPVPKEKQDIEKVSLSVLGMKAMSQGLAFNDYMKMFHGYGDGSQMA